MKQILAYKPYIDQHLQAQLHTKKNELSQINSWGSDAIDKLLPFVTSGKSIRGSLALFAYEAFGGKDANVALPVASAFELIHSGLLIHDDIMDRDILRRGGPSIYVQYENTSDATNPKQFGVSMGINAGDVCFFLGFQLLSKATPTLLTQIANELNAVVIAQMQDVAEGHMNKALTVDEVISVYRYKTARYTFSLPLMAGALLANADQSSISSLEQFGEAVGLLFQVSDDQLNAKGDATTTGKSTGSDVKNKKQTLQTKLSLTQLMKNQSDWVQKATSIVGRLSVEDVYKAELESLISFCHNRDK